MPQPFSGDGIGAIVNERKSRYRRTECRDLKVSGEAYRYCSSFVRWLEFD